MNLTLPTPILTVSRTDWRWLVCFFVLAIALFWPAREAGFVTDWTGGQERYETGTWGDVLHSFGWRALIPVLFAINFSLFKVFGTAWFPWFFIFTGLHALNAGLLFRLIRRLIPVEEVGGAKFQILAASFIGALFLCSPYAAEPIVWKACIQYPAALVLLLFMFHLAINHAEGRATDRQGLGFQSLLFLAGIFMYGWCVAMPLLLGAFVVTLAAVRGEWKTLPKRLAWQVLPLFAWLALWLVLNKIYLHQWVGHYGTAHLNFDLRLLFSTCLKYALKYAGFARYWPNPAKETAFGYLDRPMVLGAAAVLLALAFGAWLRFFKKMPARLQWAGFAGMAFFIALLPVANLYFYHLQWSENDRYGYFAGAFFWMAMVLVLAGLPRAVYLTFTIALLGISGVLLFKMTRTWGQAEEIYSGLVQDFRWYDSPEVIILASPDNLKGVSILRIIGQQSGFDEALALRRRQPYTGRMWEVAQFNMESPTDGPKIETDSTGLFFKASLPDGSWWWRNGIGASDYDTERYQFRTREWHVETILRERKAGTSVIYASGKKWVELK